MYGFNALFLASIFKGRSIFAAVVVTALGPLAIFGGVWLDSAVSSQSHITSDCIATTDEQFSSARFGKYSGTVKCTGIQTIYGRPFAQKVVFKPDDPHRKTIIQRHVFSGDLTRNMLMCMVSALVASIFIWRNSEDTTPYPRI